METDLRISRGAQADAYAIEGKTRTIATVKAVQGCEQYARAFALAPRMLKLCKRIYESDMEAIEGLESIGAPVSPVEREYADALGRLLRQFETGEGL